MSNYYAPPDTPGPTPELPQQPNTWDAYNPEGNYGQGTTWANLAAGNATPRLLVESRSPTQYLWRVQAQGTNCQFRLTWGSSSQTLQNILSPVLAFVAGRFMLETELVDTELPGTARATLTCATGGLSRVRTVQSALGAIPATAQQATALAAATIAVSAAPLVMAAGDTLPIAAPALLTAGGPLLLEHVT